MIKKEDILDLTDEKSIFNHYLKTSDFKKNISSPFAVDKKPSFKVYEPGTRNGKAYNNWSFKCHSTGKQGDCWQLVADIYNLNCKSDFNKVLEHIANDMNLQVNGSAVLHHFELTKKEWTSKGLKYWSDLGVNKELLKQYNVCEVDKYEYSKDNEIKKFKAFPGVLVYSYLVNDRYKVYIPQQKVSAKKEVNKFFHNTQYAKDVFGLKQLPDKCNNIVICAGEKDCLVAVANGFNAVSFQTEAIMPEPNIIRGLKDKCDNLLICYDNDNAGHSQAKKISERYALPIVKLPENYKDIAIYLPKHKTEAFKQLIEKSLSEHERKKHSSVFIKEHGYWKKHKGQDVELSNFIIKVIALISSENNPRRIVQLVQAHHTTDPFDLSVEAFVSKNSFRKAVESVGNYFFYGNENDLMEIKRVAFADSDITKEIIDLGYDHISNSYVLANGLIYKDRFINPDKYGIVYTGNQKGLYIPASSILNADNNKFKDSKKFKYVNSDVTVNQWYNQFEKVHGKHSIVCLAYTMAAINFDIVSDELSSFPLLNLFGPPRSGKSSLAISMLSLFGIPQEAVMLPNATQASISSKIAQFKNAIVWFDEFNNSMPDWLYQTLKGLYDLQGRLRKVFSNDNATYSSSVNSPVIVTGQEAPTDEALLSRCICIQFKKVLFNKELSDNFSDLRTLERKGLGSILIELFKYRPIVKERFKNNYDEFLTIVNNSLRQKGECNINSRLLQSYTILLSILDIYLENKFPITSHYTNVDLLNIFLDQMVFQCELEQDNNEVLVFWHCFSTLVEKGNVKENIDFRIDRDKDILSFKPSVFDLYRQYMFRTTGKWGLHKSTIQSYLKDEPYFITNKATVKFNLNEWDGDVKASNAYKVSYSLLPVKLHKESSNPFNDDEK